MNRSNRKIFIQPSSLFIPLVFLFVCLFLSFFIYLLHPLHFFPFLTFCSYSPPYIYSPHFFSPFPSYFNPFYILFHLCTVSLSSSFPHSSLSPPPGPSLQATGKVQRCLHNKSFTWGRAINRWRWRWRRKVRPISPRNQPRAEH